jgi:ABC-type transport system involved in cytochrome c biogenesis permease subunit
MGGRRNAMAWGAFTIASVCLFVKMNGQPIAIFTAWTVFVLAVLGIVTAGIVTEEKFKGDNETARIKNAATAVVETAKVESVAEVAKIEAAK